MTAMPSINPNDPALAKTLDAGEFLHEQLAQASPDLMRGLLTTFVNALLGAEADAVCRVPGLMEALIPRKDESHGSTEEVPRGASGAGDQDGGRSTA